MNDTVIDDLKQFIAATVHQDIGVIENRLDKIEATMATKTDLDRVELKIDNLTEEVGDLISGHIDLTDDRFDDHNKRITRLEHKVV